MAGKVKNIWGLSYVLSSIAFDEHIERMMKMRKVLKEKGYNERVIKRVLIMQAKFLYGDEFK